jgi:two-component system, chemotaxis family, response regulator Rcp1
MQILLVEDNAADVYLVQQALLEHGLNHDLTVTRDGDEALRLIEHADNSDTVPCPQVILLDLNLPRQDGLTVLKRVRESTKCTRTSVVILTSSDANKDREQAADLGAIYFRKPFELEDFMSLGSLVKDLINAQDAAHE